MRIQSSLGMQQQQQQPLADITTSKTSSSTGKMTESTKEKISMLHLFRTSISKGVSVVKQRVLAVGAAIKNLSFFSTTKSQNPSGSGVGNHLGELKETSERNTRHNSTSGPYPSEPVHSNSETVYATIVHPSKPLNPNRAGIPLPPIPTSSSKEIIYAELDFPVKSGSSSEKVKEPIYQNTHNVKPTLEPIYAEVHHKNIHD